MDIDTQQIKERAYAIWEEEGRPHGRDEENWRRAEAQLRDAAASVPGDDLEAAKPAAKKASSRATKAPAAKAPTAKPVAAKSPAKKGPAKKV